MTHKLTINRSIEKGLTRQMDTNTQIEILTKTEWMWPGTCTSQQSKDTMHRFESTYSY